MTQPLLTNLVNPADGLDTESWFDKIEDIAEERGYFEPLGPDHSAIFIEAGPKLLVTFETLDEVRGRTDTDVPMGWEYAETNGWSQLCLLAHGETWFRHIAVYMYFDRLVDAGFFDEFDQVVFYGAGSCGYGAAAFSVAAPGATVIAVSPQATLEPQMTEWDSRFESGSRVSFVDRYGYAPDMIEAADRAFVLYDPEISEDAMHAALFRRPNVSRIRCRHVGGRIHVFLRSMDVLAPILNCAMDGQLTDQRLHRFLRARRNYLPYLRRLLSIVEAEQRPLLTGLLCRSVLGRINTPRFRRQLSIAQQDLADLGRTMPESRE